MTIVYQVDSIGRTLYYKVGSNGVKKRISKYKLTQKQIDNASLVGTTQKSTKRSNNLLDEILEESKLALHKLIVKDSEHTDDDFHFYAERAVHKVITKAVKTKTAKQLENIIKKSEIKDYETYKRNHFNKKLGEYLIAVYILHHTDLFDEWENLHRD